MKRAAYDLARMPDERLFTAIAEGIPLIVQNAKSLDDTAHRLCREKEFRASEILRGLAEEEAAKVLILIDLVRCPRESEQRSETAKRFYDHIAKRIYSMTCSLQGIWTYKEVCDLVKRECRPFYLDGPNDIDWIFRNSIAAEREQTQYVDYVRDITEEAGDYNWRVPAEALPGLWQYVTPESVNLSEALSQCGANSHDGLAVIADVWRGFEPSLGTNRDELGGLIAYTLNRLAECQPGVPDQTAQSVVIAGWPFPLWSLSVKEHRPKNTNQEKYLRKLRDQRAQTIAWIEETDAKRDPPPQIPRAKVEALSGAYAAWEREVEARYTEKAKGEERPFRIRTLKDTEEDLGLSSNRHLEYMFGELTEEERGALLALGWYMREQFGNWPRVYERAKSSVSALSEGYQIGYGRYWLAGLNRWEAEPRPFKAGQWNRR